MNKKVLKIVNYVLFFALAVVLMYFCFKGVKFKDLIDDLKNANYYWVALSMVIGMLANVFRAMRWRMLIEPLGYRPSTYNVYNALMIGYLVNFALPRVGEISRCAVLRKTDKTPIDLSLGTVVSERVVDMICLLICILLVFVLQADVLGTFLSDNIFSVFFGKISSTFVARPWLWIAVILLLIAVPAMLYIIRRKLYEFSAVKKLRDLIKGLLNGLKSVFHLKHKIPFLLTTIGIWLCYWLTSYFTMFALPTTAGFNGTDALFLMVMGSLGWLAPVQGGFGTFHYMVALGLGLYAIPWEQGMVFATISHESQAISMIVFGFISLISVSFFIKHKTQKHKT